MKQDRTSCWLDAAALHRRLAGLLLVAVVAAMALPRTAAAQMPWVGATGTFGDLNNDRRVDTRDMFILEADFASGTNPARSDLNRDGVVNQRDATDLDRAIAIAAEGIRVPQFYFSEIRWGRPNFGGLSQARFLEFGITSQPVTTQYTGVFPAGVFYIAVAKTGSGQTGNQGIIVAVEDLSGRAFGTEGAGLGRCLLLDPYYQNNAFPLALPPASESPRNFALRNLGDPNYYNPDFGVFYEDLNVVHYLVYRRPSAGTYVSPLARPDLGQDLDTVPAPGCTIDDRSGPVGSQLPPWDFILDGVTMLRSSNAAQNATFGCPYAKGNSYMVGPDGFGSAPYHAWRCEPFGLWRFYSPLAFGADTPGRSNSLCDPENYCGSEATGDCLKPHSGPFCSDTDCCNYVCSVDVSCCELSWDTECAELAGAQCTSCGGLGTGSCFDPHDNPYCDDGDCCALICSTRPLCCVLDWDEDCAEAGQDQCLACGSPITGPCDTVHAYPSCDDIDCCTIVCNADPACCAFSWDQSCVEYAALYCNSNECGAVSAGSCCFSKDTPGCNDASVCSIVCAKDPYCCEVRWDIFCAQLADDYVPGGCACGPLPLTPPVSLNCFTTHYSPGCGDWACCDQVCNADAFCCAVEWDSACVAVAQSLCSQNFPDVCGLQLDNDPLAYSCLVVHATPGCDDGGCCDVVCSLDPFCCDPSSGWDQSCVDAAGTECESCGEALTESCYAAHGSPSCSHAECCDVVCLTDPFCCASEWDGVCVDQALSLCAEPIEQCGADGLRPCETWSTLPGCADTDCCTTICELYDPFCCETRWDAVCVQEAITFCRPPLGSGRGDCLEVHEEEGCADAACTATVCSVDPACCEDSLPWDQSCVNAAAALCLATGTCPSAGSPFTPRNEPGCEDIACCNVVCEIDPTCCDEAWDASCVQTALVQCKPFPQWECPCYGSPFEIHDNPGADDESCCSVVCQVDPGCCIDGWDEGCVVLARERCCGPIGCGSGCNGDCYVDHDGPFCADPYCCEAVCQEDPFCCSSGWDGFCAELASERCTGCGSVSPEAGCFVARESRGCNIPACCEAVCELDAFCCQTAWDATCAEQAVASSDCVDERRECGDAGLGDPCIAHQDVGSNDEDCCEAICALDSYCCETAWDATCVGQALLDDDCPCARDPGDPCAGPCCEAHEGPSCDNEDCATAVCAADAYCCSTEWDATCASSARSLCYDDNGGACPFVCGVPGSGSCCIAHISPTCDDASCCEDICAKDPYCCIQSWDETCVGLAVRGCGTLCENDALFCGSPIAGDCFKAHSDPYCDNKGCCSFVCSLLPECCIVAWDETCAAVAGKICP